ncbi:hypothetical protein OTU49_006466 [Cherax quadricarinatus]|uniref:Transmembrane protein 141 n=1 Tax=Cherax quadricarinatus TaxID=27406 RepID=A0AAW0X1K4_CHEQU|nr:uncharacterized protein LOC128692305 [Cherax quadricarinatus]XP_053637351.1 uncharacterized protein LOC128692305 [Cherax quadricarinatus]XP_053637352.1 uncharacterized protein LOC128692305 [Cherax quadricarinatus]XP_053637355.1 uncharacterized protein LOC128692305 [Cherax quadricarinatus]
MNNNTELINQYKETFPAFGSYMECMSRTFLTGLASFSLAFGGTYISQHLLIKYLPYSRKNHIIVSSVVGCCAAYQVTAVRARACQAGWMAAEDKHTFLNPISDRPKPSEEINNK